MLNARGHLGNMSVDGTVILKLILKQNIRLWSRFIWDEWWTLLNAVTNFQIS